MIHSLGGGWWKVNDYEDDYYAFHESDIQDITVQECPPDSMCATCTAVPCRIVIKLKEMEVYPDGRVYDRCDTANYEAERWRQILHFGAETQAKKGKMVMVIDQIESCRDCPFCVYDEDWNHASCLYANVFLKTFGGPGEHGWCPFHDVPERRDLEDRRDIMEWFENFGWNHCLDEILGKESRNG